MNFNLNFNQTLVQLCVRELYPQPQITVLKQVDQYTYACTMDLLKAFDLVSWCKLFPELLKREVSALLLRCLIYIYRNRTCNVKWANSIAEEFQTRSGQPTYILLYLYQWFDKAAEVVYTRKPNTGHLSWNLGLG